ncbi:MAG: hypothetical protein FWG63_03915 [Defluviitaleaceae bacterium]|nr:hypothetical protein [Defluviitaleaceae bacterium]
MTNTIDKEILKRNQELAEEKVLQRKQELERELLKAQLQVKRQKEEAEAAANLESNMFEKVLKQMITTAVEEVVATARKHSIEDYPIVLRAHHIKEIMGVSESKSYDIMRSLKCKPKRFGKIITVPRDEFWRNYLDYKGV